MKKKTLVCIITAFALALTLGLTGCSNPDTGNTAGIFESLTTTQSVYAFSAASAGMIIDSMDGQTATETQTDGQDTAQEPSTGDSAAQDTQQPSTQLSGLDNYMVLVESLLADNGFGMKEETSDKAEYTNKITMTYRDINGKSNSYVMYFNQTAVNNGDDRHHDDDEENYSINGILTIDGIDYPISGSREIENERNESEIETEFIVTLGENRHMYVEQSQESENNEFEQEFSYTIRENGVVVERNSFCYEQEDDETEIKMTSYIDGQRNTFRFNIDTYHGERALMLRIGTGKDAQRYLVTEDSTQPGGYSYQPITNGNGR